MKDRHDIKAFILKIENDFPVEQWGINDVDVWPIIRIKLYSLLISTIEKSIHTTKTKVANQKKNTLINKIVNLGEVRRLNSKRRLNKLKKVDFIFGTANTQRALYKNKSYNKFSDPIMDENNYKSLVVEHSLKHLYDLNTLYKKKRITFLYDYIDYVICSKKRKKRLTKKAKFNLQQYDDFLQVLSNEKLIEQQLEQFNLDSLHKLMNRFFDFTETYTEILNRTKPKVVFTICYYSFSAMALNYAAFLKGIKTIEIQHGPQSNLHLAYAEWSKLPENGFNTLPKVFWNWDQHSFNVLHFWANDKKKHTCFVGGNPWVDYFRNNDFNEKTVILYSLQNLTFDFLFPQYLIDKIKKVKNFEWWVRLHPRQLEHLQELTMFLKSKKIDHLVNIKEATTYPLPEVFSRTKVHITNFSGCTIEASHYGIPSILIDERGFDAFEEIIKEKKAFYSKNKEMFNFLLEDLLNDSLKFNKQENLITYKEVLSEWS